jgi:hypothetical protein
MPARDAGMLEKLASTGINLALPVAHNISAPLGGFVVA